MIAEQTVCYFLSSFLLLSEYADAGRDLLISLKCERWYNTSQRSGDLIYYCAKRQRTSTVVQLDGEFYCLLRYQIVTNALPVLFLASQRGTKLL